MFNKRISHVLVAVVVDVLAEVPYHGIRETTAGATTYE